MGLRRWSEREIDDAAAQLERHEGDLRNLQTQVAQQIREFGEHRVSIKGNIFSLFLEGEGIGARRIKQYAT